MNPFDHQDILTQYANPLLLKEGGQKVVYRVDHPVYSYAALKVGQYSSARSLERIQREVTILREIDSIYYPKNYDFQTLSNNRFLILEEYIESEPLTNCFHKYSDLDDVLSLMQDLVSGLKVIWDRRIVHRDIKPDNLLITPKRELKIIDLGIARQLDMESLTITFAGSGPCTAIYAPVEQLRNRKTEINFRTDLFSVGLVMLQLLLDGKHPFDPAVVGNQNNIVENILNDEWAKDTLNLPKILPVKSIIQKLLGHEPYQRYRKYQSLFQDLATAREALS